jgi:hypothetical protein
MHLIHRVGVWIESTLLQQLARMREMVDKFRSELRDVKPTPECMFNCTAFFSFNLREQNDTYLYLTKSEILLFISFCILYCIASCGKAKSDNGGDRGSDFDIQGAAATAVSGICV